MANGNWYVFASRNVSAEVKVHRDGGIEYFSGAQDIGTGFRTAMAVVVGGSVILFDPIFQGLAVSLMAGEVASLLLSRMAVPIIYYHAMRHDRNRPAGAERSPADRLPGDAGHQAP
jgi:hypothetical protein